MTLRYLVAVLFGTSVVAAVSASATLLEVVSGVNQVEVIAVDMELPPEPVTLTPVLQNSEPHVLLTWIGDGRLTGYYVMRALNGGDAALLAEAMPGGDTPPDSAMHLATYVDWAVTAGEAYSYHVIGYDAQGTVYPASNVVTIAIASPVPPALVPSPDALKLPDDLQKPDLEEPKDEVGDAPPEQPEALTDPEDPTEGTEIDEPAEPEEPTDLDEPAIIDEPAEPEEPTAVDEPTVLEESTDSPDGEEKP